jgi:hypothetical protein
MRAQRRREFVETSPQARQTLRTCRTLASSHPSPPQSSASRQETQLLLFAYGGATNKDAAKALRFGKAALKFHVGAAYPRVWSTEGRRPCLKPRPLCPKPSRFCS